MNPTEAVSIREAQPEDIPQIIALERGSASAAHWNESDYARNFDSGDPSLIRRLLLVLERSSSRRLLGFIAARVIHSDWEIENIVIAENVQRQGHGRQLLTVLIKRARTESAQNILLEVRESNQSALALYNKCGFLQEGRRKNYYADPEEDAFLLRLKLHD